MRTFSKLNEVLDELTADIERSMAESGVPGCAVGVLLEDQTATVARGITNVDAPLAVDGQTLFQIGSTTKTMTATLAMMLVEQNRLALDSPIHQIVPELRLADARALEEITLRDLLTHMGGHDGDLFDDFGRGDDALSLMCAAMDRLPQLAPLRALWNYSNAGYSVIGRAIEVLTDMPFERAVDELLLCPLGMQQSAFFAEDCILGRTAVGHRVADGRVSAARPWALPRAANPAGGLSSSIRDQLRYAAFHLGDGRAADGSQLLRPETMRLMQQPHAEAGGGRAVAVGFSWLLQATPGLIAHGGETNGQSSAFVIVPERRFAIVVCTNSERGAVVHGPIVKRALREIAGVTPARPNMRPERDTSVMRSYAGTYLSRMEEITVTIDGSAQLAVEPTDHQLLAFPGSTGVAPSHIELYDGGGVRVAEGPLAGARGEFLQDEHGDVRWLRIFGRLHLRTDR